MSSGETTWSAAAITCASNGLPPTSCSTLGCFDFSRVPLPAAMIAIASLCEFARLCLVSDIQINITEKVTGKREVGFTTQGTQRPNYRWRQAESPASLQAT